jgi:hypothetical protein
MKTTILSLLLMSTLGMAQQNQAVSNTQVSPQALYNRGVLAMNRGDVVNAEKDLRAVLQAQPQHPHARYALNQLLLNRSKFAARDRENKMKQTIIAKVEYSDASVSECMESLTIQIKAATEQKFSPNFILKDPMGRLKDKSITLQLANIPASQVLQYIATTAQCKIVYEEHAIVIEAK